MIDIHKLSYTFDRTCPWCKFDKCHLVVLTSVLLNRLEVSYCWLLPRSTAWAFFVELLSKTEKRRRIKCSSSFLFSLSIFTISPSEGRASMWTAQWAGGRLGARHLTLCICWSLNQQMKWSANKITSLSHKNDSCTCSSQSALWLFPFNDRLPGRHICFTSFNSMDAWGIKQDFRKRGHLPSRYGWHWCGRCLWSICMLPWPLGMLTPEGCKSIRQSEDWQTWTGKHKMSWWNRLPSTCRASTVFGCLSKRKTLCHLARGQRGRQGSIKIRIQQRHCLNHTGVFFFPKRCTMTLVVGHFMFDSNVHVLVPNSPGP